MVLYLIGEDCQDIYATLNDTGDDYVSVLTTLDSHFIPPCNVSYERHIFNSCKQEKGENMDAYVTRLRVLSKTCDFGDGVDERLRDQIVQGCFSHELRKIFLKSEGLTLVKILKKAKVVEMAEGQLKHMKGETKEHICMVQSRKNKHFYPGKSQSNFRDNPGYSKGFDRNRGQMPISSKSLKCYRCDREGHMAKSETCPARNRTCKSCGKVAHFAIVCKTTKTKVSAVRTNRRPTV